MANILDTAINKLAEMVGPDHGKKDKKVSTMTDHPSRNGAEYMLGSGMLKNAADKLRKRKDIGDLSQY